MGTVFGATQWPDPIPVSLTCGTGEENRSNNAGTAAAALARQGYDVRLHEIRTPTPGSAGATRSTRICPSC